MSSVWLAAAVTVAGALAACAAGWPISRSEIGSPPPNAARLIVYRPSGVMLAWRSLSVDVDGAAACDLPRGSGFAKDVESGKVTVAAHLWSVPGESSLSWTAETTKIYYVRVRVKGETSPGVVGGLLGLGSEAASGDSGPFDLDLTDEDAAIASGVKLSQCSR